MNSEYVDGRKGMQKNIRSEQESCGHEEDCLAIWIFEDWQPQNLAYLTFVKS